MVTMKRLKKMVCGVAVTTALMVAPVLAATNYNWSGYAYTPGSSILTAAKTKTTNSSVVANYSSGSSEWTNVTVQANVGGSWKDCTYYTSSHPVYRAYRGTGSDKYIDVLNTAYEKYGTVNVRAVFSTLSAGNHSGKWRPDYQ